MGLEEKADAKHNATVKVNNSSLDGNAAGASSAEVPQPGVDQSANAKLEGLSLDSLLSDEDMSHIGFLSEDLPSKEPEVELSPMNRFLKLVLFQAYNDNASDIYFENYYSEFKIRYRVDGVLYEMAPPPKRLFQPVGVEIKQMFGLVKEDFTKVTRWQAFRGHIPQYQVVPLKKYTYDQIFSKQLLISGKEVNINLSMLPVENHEHYHIEIFNRKNMPMSLDEEIKRLIDNAKSGLIVISSPQDGGKTTTAYQILNYVNRPDKAVVSVEKKDAYPLAGVSKVRVDSNADDYKQRLAALKSYHPDVILFDDLSDGIAAKEAVRYANDGKLVIVTLNGKDVKSTLDNLSGLTGSITNIANIVRGIITQRLVRQIHPECEGRGCDKCDYSYAAGLKGRFAARLVVDFDNLAEYANDVKNGNYVLLNSEKSISSVLDKLVERKVIPTYVAEEQKKL